MRTSALFGAKFGFFEIYGVSARGGELCQCGYFADKRRSIFQFFRDFVQTSFKDGL